MRGVRLRSWQSTSNTGPSRVDHVVFEAQRDAFPMSLFVVLTLILMPLRLGTFKLGMHAELDRVITTLVVHLTVEPSQLPLRGWQCCSRPEGVASESGDARAAFYGPFVHVKKEHGVQRGHSGGVLQEPYVRGWVESPRGMLVLFSHRTNRRGRTAELIVTSTRKRGTGHQSVTFAATTLAYSSHSHETAVADRSFH